MKDKFKKALIVLATFIVVFILHILYFKVTEGGCGSAPWLKKYITEEEYFLGISYALSLGFMALAFLKYKESRINALKAAAGGGLLAIVLWLSCFFFGCCGSPMLIMYLNLIGLSSFKVPKFALLLMTVIFISIGYFCFIRENCCNGNSCRKEKDEKI